MRVITQTCVFSRSDVWKWPQVGSSEPRRHRALSQGHFSDELLKSSSLGRSARKQVSRILTGVLAQLSGKVLQAGVQK